MSAPESSAIVPPTRRFVFRRQRRNLRFYVYLLKKRGVVFYVGHTTNMTQRMREHRCYKRPDEIRYFEVDSYTKMVAEERRLIRALRPRGNTRVL